MPVGVEEVKVHAVLIRGYEEDNDVNIHQLWIVPAPAQSSRVIDDPRN